MLPSYVAQMHYGYGRCYHQRMLGKGCTGTFCAVLAKLLHVSMDVAVLLLSEATISLRVAHQTFRSSAKL